jgi:hypothetical protein
MKKIDKYKRMVYNITSLTIYREVVMSREQFKKRVLNAIDEYTALGYRPTALIKMIRTNHPVEVAKRLVVSGIVQDGYIRLKEMNRMDLTIESMMLEPESQSLFNSSELAAAKWRIENC